MNYIQLTKRVWHDPAYFIAFGFGFGLMKKAPGTWGTLAAVPLYLVCASLHWSLYLIILLGAFILGVFVSNTVTNDLGIQDYKGIVWDEVVGYLLTMYLAPPGLLWVILGFILFRVFDIWKPYPIYLVDKTVHGGLGVMLDDVLAAIPAWIILHCLFWIIV